MRDKFVDGVPDDENPEWTPEEIRTAQPFAEVFPDLAAHAPPARPLRPKIEAGVQRIVTLAPVLGRCNPGAVATVEDVIRNLIGPPPPGGVEGTATYVPAGGPSKIIAAPVESGVHAAAGLQSYLCAQCGQDSTLSIAWLSHAGWTGAVLCPGCLATIREATS